MVAPSGPPSRLTCVEFLEEWYGLTLTHGQRAFVMVAIDRVPIGELPPLEREAALAMFGDLTNAAEGAWRTIVAACGRDSGKTELGAGIALYLLLTVDVSRCGAGDIPRGFVVAPDIDTAKLTVERAIARVQDSTDLAALLVGKPGAEGFTIRRPTDGRTVTFEVKSASVGGRSIRGRSIVVLVLDEAGLFYGQGYAVNDAEIVKAARPRLLSGGVVLMLSTPWTEEGLFFELYSKNHGTAQTAIVACASTLVMRDHDPEIAARIALEMEEDPENAEREYNARFISGGSSLFFDPEALADAARPVVPEEFATRAAGADVGLVRDSSAIAVVGRRENARRPEAFELALLEAEEYRPSKGAPLKLSNVVGSFATVMRRHGIREVLADGHAREPAREWAAEEGIQIAAGPEGPTGKWDTFVFVRTMLGERRLAISSSPRLIAQLRAVRSKPIAGGGYQITSPRRAGGGHGDLASAFVLACWAARESSYGIKLAALSRVMRGLPTTGKRKVSAREERDRTEMIDAVRMTRTPAEANKAIAQLRAQWAREDDPEGRNA